MLEVDGCAKFVEAPDAMLKLFQLTIVPLLDRVTVIDEPVPLVIVAAPVTACLPVGTATGAGGFAYVGEVRQMAEQSSARGQSFIM